MSAGAYGRIYQARDALLLTCIEEFGATASNRDLSYLSGLELPRIVEGLKRLETEDRIARRTLGHKRKIEILKQEAQEARSGAGATGKDPDKARSGAGATGKDPDKARSGAGARPSQRNRKPAPALDGLPANRRPAMRTCLACRKPFKSDHAGVRRCPDCKLVGASETPFDPI